jgi:hypothetical protein
MVAKYRGSVATMLQSVYEEQEWLPWKFSKTARGFWKVFANQKYFMNWAGKQLGVKQYEDWYEYSLEV